MFDTKFIDELSQKLSGAMPPGTQQLRSDLERNVKAILRSSFEKLDLVSREEFDVQSEVLANTRAKLKTLEQQVAALEAQVKGEQQSPEAGKKDS